MTTTAPRTRALPRWAAPALDATALALFVLIGRREHGIADGITGYLTTLWPFVAGWAVVALADGLYRRPLDWGRWAITWPLAVAAALTLRIAFTGHSFVVAFAIVALLVVGAFTAAWRAVAALVLRAR